MPSVLFLAGEPSGDANCARLARELLRRHPDWTLYALGGRHLRATGAKLIGDTSGLGVIGFASALAVLPRALRLRRRVLKFLDTTKVDLAIPCDWGGFNGRLLEALKARGIPSLYYFPPRSWHRERGGESIAPFVSAVATPFEWSAKRLQAAGARAEWVGHPLLEEVGERPSRELLRREFHLRDDEKLLALLPGSRAMELRLLSPVLREAALRVKEQGSAHRFVAAAAPGDGPKVRRQLPNWIEVLEGRTTDVLKACDAAIVKSGTSTLQAASCGAPQVIVYDVPPLLRAQWKWTGMARKTPFVGMPNIILGREACRELLGPECRAEIIAPEVASLLQDAAKREAMQRDYEEVRGALGEKLPQRATIRVAEMVEELMPS